MSDELDDNDDSEGVTRFPGRPGGPPAKVDIDVPLTNTDPIPLFPDADKRMAKRGQWVAISRLDPPGHGFKGKEPIGIDMEYVARKFGDGNYTFEILNNKGEVLRRREAVSIACGIDPLTLRPKGEAEPHKNSPNADGIIGIVKDLLDKLERDRGRDDSQAQEIIKQARDLAKQHIEMVIASSKDSAGRDHDHHTQQANSQKQFFESILAAAQQGSQLLMTQLTTIFTQQQQWQAQNHTQTMQMMMAMGERERQLNNPALLLKLFREGMEAGQSAGGSDAEPWERGMSLAFGGLKELRGLAKDATEAVNSRRALLSDVRKRKQLVSGSPTNKDAPKPNSTTNNQGTKVIMKRRRETTGNAPVTAVETKPETETGLG